MPGSPDHRAASIQADRLAEPPHEERQESVVARHDLDPPGHPQLDRAAVRPAPDLVPARGDPHSGPTKAQYRDGYEVTHASIERILITRPR